MIIDSVEMILSLPEEKVVTIKQQCSEMLEKEKVSLRELAKLVGRLSASMMAILPAPLQYRGLQRQQIFELKNQGSYDHRVTLTEEAKEEINWWLFYLDFYNGRSLIISPPQIVIQTDASKTGWGAACRNQSTGGSWSQKEQQEHINVLELRAAQLGLLTFVPRFKATSVHIQMDNVVALKYLLKMGGTKSLEMNQISKDIWDFLMEDKIMLTAENLPGVLNVEADRESRLKDSSEWKLNPGIFKKICQLRGTPDIDLFASRVSNQVPAYYSWKIDPFSKGQDAFQQDWRFLRGYAFPPFSLIGRVLRKIEADQAKVILVTPAWQGQAWYPTALRLSVMNPILLPQDERLLQHQGITHPLVQNRSLRLIAWTLSGNSLLQKAFQRKLQVLSSSPGVQELNLITNRPGDSGLAGVLNNKLIQLDVL